MAALLRYIEFIPAYVSDLIAFLTSPKTFLQNRNRGAENWSAALRFFAFSAILGFMLGQFGNTPSPLPKDDNNIIFNIATSIVFFGVYILFGAVAIKASWKFVGGKASFYSIILTHLYCFSLFILIITISALAVFGLCENILPELSEVAVKSMKD